MLDRPSITSLVRRRIFFVHGNKKDKILYYVLDQVQRGDYDAARCSWISYTLSQISNSSIVKEKKNSDCGMMQHWNCESSTYSNLAMMESFSIYRKG